MIPTLLELPVLAQRDPRWRSEKLGNSQLTIGDYGCLLLSATNMHGIADPNVTVVQMNAALRSLGVFGTGKDGAKFATFDLRGIGWELARVTNRYVKALMPARDVADTVAWLRSGRPAVLEVNVLKDAQLARGGQHFVLGVAAFGSDSDPQIVINDPWYNRQTTISPHYGANARIALVRSILYRRA